MRTWIPFLLWRKKLACKLLEPSGLTIVNQGLILLTRRSWSSMKLTTPEPLYITLSVSWRKTWWSNVKLLTLIQTTLNLECLFCMTNWSQRRLICQLRSWTPVDTLLLDSFQTTGLHTHGKALTLFTTPEEPLNKVTMFSCLENANSVLYLYGFVCVCYFCFALSLFLLFLFHIFCITNSLYPVFWISSNIFSLLLLHIFPGQILCVVGKKTALVCLYDEMRTISRKPSFIIIAR